MASLDMCSFNTALFEVLWMFYKVEFMQSVAAQSLVDDGSWYDLQPAVVRAELRALFPDRGVNGFPYWVVREEQRRFFKHSVSEN